MSKHSGSLFLLFLALSLSVFAQSHATQPSKAAPAVSKQEQAKLEQHLRERCEGIYSAVQNAQWRKVQSFLDEDAKIVWASMRKAAIYGFKVKTVTVAADGKSGSTEVIVDSPVLVSGYPENHIVMPQTLEWELQEGEWYVLLRGNLAPLPPTGPDGRPLKAEAPEESKIKGELEFTSDTFDFKFIRQGETIQAKYWFTNTSDHVVKVTAAISNPCDCVTAKVSKDQFKPGEEGFVEATMGTKLFGGNIQQGLEARMQPSGAKTILRIEGYVLLPNQKAAGEK